MESSDSMENLNGKIGSTRSKIPCILLTISVILIIVSFILIISVLIQIKDLKESQDQSQGQEQEKKTGHAPVIGLTGMRVPTNPNETKNMTEDALTNDEVQIHYIEAIERAGGIPLSLPVLQTFNIENMKRQIELVDALLIQGGLDVDPSFYQEDRDEKLGQTNIKTDKYLIEAIKIANSRKIPILGICRGMQILNVAFGGNLFQDLSKANISVPTHRQDYTQLCEVKHNISILDNSLMSKMLNGQKTIGVNSWHHQAVDRLAEGFKVDAWADDGKIAEAMHYEGDPDQWIFAVQFHPEQFMRCGNDVFKPIFDEFIKQAKNKRDKK